MLRQAVVFCALLAIAAAYEAQGPLEPIPEKFKGQQGCYIKAMDKVIPFNQKVTSHPGCAQYYCYENGYTITGCGSVVVSPPCKLVSDENKPYPGCCPTPSCP